MTEILKELDQAFRLLSFIPVSGDNVEIMAEAKARLRKINAQLQNMKVKDSDAFQPHRTTAIQADVQNRPYSEQSEGETVNAESNCK